MGMVQRNRWFSAVGVAALGAFALASVASAQVSTEQSGSIVIFPKIVWDGTRDTIIQMANTGNPPAFAHCFYVNAGQPGQWQETDFDLFLTKQQPTQWVASSGRRVNFFDDFGGPQAGLDPGLIPAVPVGFVGELKCIQTNDDGSPLRANKLKGEATLRSSSGDVSKYNAITLQGNPNFAVSSGAANELVLDRSGSGAAETGEYDPCPNALVLNHFAHGADDPFADSTTIDTTLTLVPCSENLETGEPGVVTVQFQIYDEFERLFSTSDTVDCFLNRPLDEIGIGSAFTIGTLTTLSAQTRIVPIPGHGGVLGVAEEVRTRGSNRAWAAYNLVADGNRLTGATDLDGKPIDGVTDTIVVPPAN